VENTNYVRVGWLGRTRGLRGEIWVTPDTDFPERFVDLKEVFLKSRDEWEKFTIVSSTMIGGRPALRFEKISSKEDAARLTNRELAVPRDQVVRLADGSHYIFDLIGCCICDAASGDVIGELVDVEQYPANDLYVIEMPDKQRVHCPAVQTFVTEIDIEGRRILVNRIGLYDAMSSENADANEV